jgi:hypothetical protein
MRRCLDIQTARGGPDATRQRERRDPPYRHRLLSTTYLSLAIASGALLLAVWSRQHWPAVRIGGWCGSPVRLATLTGS